MAALRLLATFTVLADGGIQAATMRAIGKGVVFIDVVGYPGSDPPFQQKTLLWGSLSDPGC